MARHDYNFRPKPAYDGGGRFVPPAPVPVDYEGENSGLIEAIRSGFAMTRNPVEATSVASLTKPYARAEFFGTTLTVPGDPEMIRHCFVTNKDNYELHPIRQAILRPILDEGLISAQGESWKRARRLLSPMFTPRHIQSFSEVMRQATERELPALLDGADEVLFSDKMLELTYLVLSDTLFSGDIARETTSVLRDVAILLASMGRPHVLDMFSAPKWIPRLGRKGGERAVRRLRAMVRELCELRREERAAGRDLPDDFLTLLLEAGEGEDAPLTDKEIEDHILTFIGAGHETTSRALTWMFYLLDNDKDARSQMEAEVDRLDMSLPAQDWVEYMPWSMACFEETMRLYPPAPIISRIALENDKFEDVHIAKDSSLMVNLWALHRNERLWAHPNSFDPARFYGEARDKIDRFQYLPFGMGARVCIGARFAMQEAAILIAHLVKRYRFTYAGQRSPWPIMRITVRPDNHMPMRVEKR